MLLCSLLVSLSVGCHVSDVNSESRSVSAAYLWGMVHRGPVLIKEDIKLCGFVSLNDRLGETSRSVIISDESGGVELKIDIDKLYKVLPFGCSVELFCSGLYVGREGDALVMGVQPTGTYSVDLIPEDRLHNYIRVGQNILPEADVMALADISTRDIFRYVMIEGVEVVAEERDATWCDMDDAIGQRVTTLRHFTDGCDTIAIVTSPKAIYSGDRLPRNKVRCIGVVDTYNDELALRLANYQIAPME